MLILNSDKKHIPYNIKRVFNMEEEKMKHFRCVLSAALAVLMLITGIPFAAAAESETEIPEGYEAIYDIEDLYLIRYNLSGKYILMADIDMTDDIAPGADWDYDGMGWLPIGNSEGSAFTGVFDGNGHTINGMRIEESDVMSAGLFGYIDGGIVRDLRMTNTVMTGDACRYAGSVAGHATASSMERIAVEDMALDVSYVDRKSTGNTRYLGYVGGIVGYITAGESGVAISESYVTGNIRDKGRNIVGTIAANVSGTMADCYSDATLDVIWDSASGGLVQYGDTIINCINYGSYFCTYACNIAYSAENIYHCYYTKGSSAVWSGTDGFEAAMRLTPAMMDDPDVFCWLDFENTWVIDPDSGFDYPQLKNNRQYPDSGKVPEAGEEEPDENVPEGYTGIYDIADLFKIHFRPDGSYILMNDLDVTKDTADNGNWSVFRAGWIPLGTTPETAFTGIFDGNCHTITGLNICSEKKRVGLFGYVDGGTIKNLRIKDAVIDYAYDCSGIVAAEATSDSRFENIAVDNAKIRCISKNCCVGGLVGKTTSGVSIEKCYVTGAITSEGGENRIGNYLGGICGYSYGSITDCYSDALITVGGYSFNNSAYYAQASYAGGIAGYGANVNRCINVGKIVNSNAYASKGALIYSGNVYNSYYMKNTAPAGKYAASDTVDTAICVPENQMKLQAVFTKLDFEDTWFLDTSTGINHPQLLSAAQCKPITAMELKCSPEAVIFRQYDEFSAAGAQLEVVYKAPFDGKGVVDITDDMCSGYDMTATGTQEVTVSYCGLTEKFTITVEPLPVESIVLDYTEITLDIHETQQITAVVSPDNATDKTLEWTSDNENVAVVDADGVVTATGRGTAIISATAASGVTASLTVNVLVPSTGIAFAEDTLEIEKGSSLRPEIVLTPADSTDELFWASSDEDVAVVDENGVITAIEKGQAVITVTTASGASAECNVSVLVPASGIEITEYTLSTEATDKFEFSAVLTPDNTTDSIIWSVSDSSIAAIDADGMLSAIAAGTVTVTATATSGVSASVDVTVLPHTHKLGDEIVVAPSTCSTNGTAYKECSKCGHKENISLPTDAETHSGGTELRDYVKETCGKDGYTGNTCCTGCNAVLEEGSVISATGKHNYEGSITKEPDCSDEGIRTYCCTVCKDSYTEVIGTDADVHAWGDWETMIKPDCVTEGIRAKRCADCNVLSTGKVVLPKETYPESTHSYANNMNETYTFSCPQAKRLYIKFSAYTVFEKDYDYLYVYDADGSLIKKYTGTELAGLSLVINGNTFSLKLTSDGSQTKYGFSFSEIRADLVEFIEDNYVLSDELCEIIPATGIHSYNEEIVTAATCAEPGKVIYTCEDCLFSRTGATDPDPENHVGESELRNVAAANCGNSGYSGDLWCLSCDTRKQKGSVTEATGNHNYKNSITTAATCCTKGVRTYECSVCDDKYEVDVAIDSKKHSGKTELRNTRPNGCAVDGYSGDKWCLGCNTMTEKGVVIPATGKHKYTSKVTTPATHLKEGVRTFTCGCGHSYKEAVAKTTKHTYKAVVTSPTCTKKGFTTHTCDCGDSYVDNYTNKIAHKYTSVVTTPATYLNDGVRTYKCSCGHSYTEKIEKLSSGFSDSTSAKVSGSFIVAVAGKTAADILSQATAGSEIKDNNGKTVNAGAVIGTGMTIVLADGKKHTVVVFGDVDGDGGISAADARLALRASVGLEDYKKDSPQYKAADVDGQDKVSAADARLILRASVGLEDSKGWLK